MSSALSRRTEASNGCEYIVVINLKLQKAQSAYRKWKGKRVVEKKTIYSFTKAKFQDYSKEKSIKRKRNLDYFSGIAKIKRKSKGKPVC